MLRDGLAMDLCRTLKGLLFFCSLVVLGGCELMPASGPASLDMRAWQDNPNIPYAFVPVTPKITAVLARAAPRLIEFRDRRRPRDIRFGVGDIVSVTIFEASSGGLFIPAE